MRLVDQTGFCSIGLSSDTFIQRKSVFAQTVVQVALHHPV